MIELKPTKLIEEELGKTCYLPDCNNSLTRFVGPGQNQVCYEHQMMLVPFGGFARLDRPYTFYKTELTCECCGYNALEDPRVAIIKNESVKVQVARTLIHMDHRIRQAAGGLDTQDNIWRLCYHCHTIKTVMESQGYQLIEIYKELGLTDEEIAYIKNNYK